MMEIKFRKASPNEIDAVLFLLKQAAKTLAQKGIDQWAYWTNPPQEKVDWVKVGFANGEFYFVENEAKQVMAMFRLLNEDTLYWGQMAEEARYIHSLVVHKDFAGNKLGLRIVAELEKQTVAEGVNLLRLDCDATNAQLCKYYINQGFIQVGVKYLPLGKYNLYEKALC